MNHFQKRKKICETSEVIAYQPKAFEESKIVDTESDIIEHPITSHKLTKTIRMGEKVDYSNSLYSEYKVYSKYIVYSFLNEKNVKITKQTHAFKGL